MAHGKLFLFILYRDRVQSERMDAPVRSDTKFFPLTPVAAKSLIDIPPPMIAFFATTLLLLSLCLPQLALCGGKGGDPADMDPMDYGFSLGVGFGCCALLGSILFGMSMLNQRSQSVAAH
jgi:hypothetical protein